jgi:hypothetical protein
MNTKLNIWRILSNDICCWKRNAYPYKSYVYVSCTQYTGHGIVDNDGNCPVDKLAVRLENGNTWWYPLDACSEIWSRKEIPPSLKRMRRRM